MSNEINDLKTNPQAIRIYLSKVKLKKEGREYLGLCPFHSEKTPSFRVSQHDSTWIWKCFAGCGAGNIIQFVQKIDNVDFKTAVATVRAEIGSESWENQKTKVDAVFKPAFEQKQDYVTYSLEEYRKLEQGFQDSMQAQEWLFESRGISADVAERLHVGFKQEIRFKENPEISNKGWLVFPCIEGDKVVSIKYRSIVKKSFSRQPKMKTGLFNTNTIDPLEDVYVCEGEMDVLTLEQAGFRAVSIPSAGAKLSPKDKDLLMTANRVILAGDSDGPGAQTMDKLWRELQERTYLLTWPEGVKDANQALTETCKRHFFDFRELVLKLTQQALTKPMLGVFSLQEAMLTTDEINISESPDRLHFPWKAVDEMVNILPGGVLFLTSTSSGMGKTVWSTQVSVYGARKHAETVLNYQCEMTAAELANIVAAHVLMKDRNSLTKDDYKLASRELSGIQYYVGHDPSLDRVGPVLDLIEAAIRRLGATLIILDHVHFVCRNEKDILEVGRNAMQRIKNMASKYRAKFILLGQPRKPDSQSAGKSRHVSDIYGGEQFASDSNAVFFLHREISKNSDPNNPPSDAFGQITTVEMKKARAKGKGAAFAKLYYNGDLATFTELATEAEII